MAFGKILANSFFRIVRRAQNEMCARNWHMRIARAGASEMRKVARGVGRGVRKFLHRTQNAADAVLMRACGDCAQGEWSARIGPTFCARGKGKWHMYITITYRVREGGHWKCIEIRAGLGALCGSFHAKRKMRPMRF
ncbi:MAG: hypothetical protein DBX55_10355 [Verrucomicrobia bacterium]|nr:MAG: hypothetical protein DBX55_10355 [Verrucomicrobiota bacterium]